MSSAKNYWLCCRCLSVGGPEPQTSLPPLTHYTVYVYTLFTQGRGGGRVEPERRLEGRQFTKLGRKYQHDCLYLQSINSDKHLPQRCITVLQYVKQESISLLLCSVENDLFNVLCLTNRAFDLTKLNNSLHKYNLFFRHDKWISGSFNISELFSEEGGRSCSHQPSSQCRCAQGQRAAAQNRRL